MVISREVGYPIGKLYSLAIYRTLLDSLGGLANVETSYISITGTPSFDPASEADKRSDPPAEGESVEAGGNECED